MRNYTLTSAAVVVAAIVLLVSTASSARTGNAAETLQAMREADLAGILGSAEVPYPSRPNIFKSPVELRQYLDALNAYYAIAGRPRFGKRGGNMRSSTHDDFLEY
ncbi:uncharacterized protein [Palaemon carinicauda]|uniref:uncharacterized protein n=1 Tax=Palaemon carinicauda TaxID=392227 RepID=UPI002798BAEF|nr:neuropeptide F2 [Palaemon carinicauda]